jgi:hemerythrin-like domain-containing protein
LLSAFFLRNGLEQNCVHVISPDHTLHMKTFFEVTECIAKEKPQPKDDQKYKFYIDYFTQYVDSVHDLFEHKFLVFLCNPSEMHWITIVVVSSSLLYNSDHKRKTIQPS